MKKKSIVFTIVFSMLMGLFISCPVPACSCGCYCERGCNCGCIYSAKCEICGYINKRKMVDFRIKDNSGKLKNNSRAASTEIAELIEVEKAEGLSEEEIKSLFEFSDDAGGVRITFKRPEALSKGWKSDYFRMFYFDKSDFKSTQMAFAKGYGFDASDEKNLVEEYTWVYPLVNAGNSYKFQLTGTFIHQYDESGNWINGEQEQVKFTLYYNITPKHGIGMIDEVPENFRKKASEYINFNNGLISLKDVIPPQSDYAVKKVVNVFGTDTENYWDWTDMDQFVERYTVNIDTGNDTEFYIVDAPVSSLCKKTDRERLYKDYVVVQFCYEYSVENYENLIFFTPEITSKAYHPNFFYDPYNERMVSETKMEDNKVSFSGDGEFDGLYESDIDIDFDDGTYTPAIFVYGTKVYVLSVEDGIYTAKKSLKVSDFLLEGGNFKSGNLVIKSTFGEGNIAKSNLKEITFTGSF